jgi:hypothetical protein
MRNRIRSLRWLFPALACLTVLGGCGKDSLRQAIDGTVTLDGAPLAKGYISFRPEVGSPGPTAGAEVVDGKYSISTEGGTFAGKFRVEITASRRSGKKIPDRFTGELVDEYAQYLPERYNTQSELTAEVKGEGENQFEFTLDSG